MSVSVRPTYDTPPRYRVIVWTFHILLGQVLNELYDNKRDAYKRARQLRDFYRLIHYLNKGRGQSNGIHQL